MKIIIQLVCRMFFTLGLSLQFLIIKFRLYIFDMNIIEVRLFCSLHPSVAHSFNLSHYLIILILICQVSPLSTATSSHCN